MSRASEINDAPFEIYDLDELDNLPDPVPLIEGVLNRGCVALLFGEYGTGKSFLALDWAAHLAAGIDWFGHQIYGEHNILYVAAEGASGLKLRRKAWEIGHDQKIPVANFHLTRVAVRFGNDDEHFDYLQEMIRKNEYDFIVIDTLSRNTPGMDENGPDMSEFIERVFQLRDAHSTEKTAFLIVHHAGKDKTRGARGWTGIPAATDFSYRMSMGSVPEVKRFELTSDRTKDAEPIDPMSFMLESHKWENDKGFPQDSCTLVEDTGGLQQQPSSFAATSQTPTPPWNEDVLEDTELTKKDRPRGKSRARGPNGRSSAWS